MIKYTANILEKVISPGLYFVLLHMLYFHFTKNIMDNTYIFVQIPHQKEFCKHLNHDRFYDFQHCSVQEPVPCGMQLSHAFPMPEAVYPLQKTRGCALSSNRQQKNKKSVILSMNINKQKVRATDHCL